MTLFLTVEQVIRLHDQEKTCPLIDYGKLASAVGQPSQTWGGNYLYPTLVGQAAVLLFGICSAHAFEDANKRTAWIACVTFLELNGLELVDVPQNEVVSLMKAVACGQLDPRQITEWLLNRI